MLLDLAYAAAFLDCDGTIIAGRDRRVRNNGRCYYFVKINFYSQNRSILEDLRETVGGTITPPNMSVDVFTLQLAPTDTLKCLKMLLPHLRIKREQALLALDLDRHIKSTKRIGRKGKNGGGGAFQPDSVVAERESMRNRMVELNHRDPKAFREYRTNWVNSVKTSSDLATPSQAAEGEGSAEGVTTREVSPNNNPLQENPARKGRDSLSSVENTTIH